MKSYDLCAMGNGIVDILIEVSDEELKNLGWEKGSWGMISTSEVDEVVKKFSDREQALASGGSAANSMIMFAQLGGKGAFFASLGDDKLGKHFISEFESFGATFGSRVTSSAPTGCCLSMITPDAERTMRVCLGASNDFAENQMSEDIIANSDWMLVEGYLFSGGKIALDAINWTLKLADKHSTKIAMTVSAVPIIENYRSEVEKVLAKTELLFANEIEAQVLANTKDLSQAVDILSAQVPCVVVTVGPEGAYICCDGAQMQVPACKCTPVDLTGAGDAFAGAYLYGITHGYTPRECGERAARMSKEIITRKGARYTGSVEELRNIFK